MNRQVILGQLRELLTILGALCFTMLPDQSVGSIVGAIVAAVAIVFAIVKHDGVESLFTLARKFLSILPAIGVQFGWIDSGMAAKLIAGLAPLSALVWSYLVNAGVAKGSMPVNLILIALSPVFAFSLPSCSYADVIVDTRGGVATAPDNDLDGLPDEITVPSNQVRPTLNDKGLTKLNEGVAEIIINATK